MKKKKEIEDDFKVFGTAHIAILERLDNSDLRELVINTLKYAKDKTVRHFESNIAEFVFNSFKVEIDDEIARLKSISEKRRNSGRNGGLAKGSKCYQMLSKAKKHEEKEEKTENFDFSPNYNKNIIKEVIINKEEDIQEDNINPIQDNNINSPNKDERNINISSIQKAPSENPETEKKPSKESSERIDYARLLEFFNKCMQGKAINPIKAITDRRKQHIATRAREFGKNAIMTVIEKAAASDYLNGYHGGRAWKADFDWLFLPTKFPKILEGYYDNDNFKEHQELSKKKGYVDPMIADGTRLRQDQMNYTKNIW